MTVVNFSVTKQLEKKINKIVDEWGFSSRAEFFRYLAINFIDQYQMRGSSAHKPSRPPVLLA